MQQWVIGEENQSVSHPFFGEVRIRQKCVVHPLGNFYVACREDRSIASATDKPPCETRARAKSLC